MTDDPILRWDGERLTVDGEEGLAVKPLSDSALAAAVLRVAVGAEVEASILPDDLAVFRREWLTLAGQRWALPASAARDWWARRHPGAPTPPPIPGTDAEPYTSEGAWLAARRRGIGGSDAATLMGVSSWSSPLALFLEKTGAIAPQPPGDPESVEWGHRLEDDVLDWYQERSGRPIIRPGRFTIYRSRAVACASVTLDGLILNDPRGLGVVNAKTASAFIADRWAKDPPLAYQVQLAHEMMVTGATWGAIPVLIGGQRADVFELSRDDAFIAVLIEREVAFWRLVETNVAPEEDDPGALREALRRRFPRAVAGTTVDLGEEGRELDERREVAAEAIKRWALDKTDIENKLIAMIGDAEFGALPSGAVYRRRVIPRAAYTVAATEYRELRRLNHK